VQMIIAHDQIELLQFHDQGFVGNCLLLTALTVPPLGEAENLRP
jgi:hypothetical protein